MAQGLRRRPATPISLGLLGVSPRLFDVAQGWESQEPLPVFPRFCDPQPRTRATMMLQHPATHNGT